MRASTVSFAIALLVGCGANSPGVKTPLRVAAPEAGALAEPPPSPPSEAFVEIVLRPEGLQAEVDRQLPNPLHRESGGRLEAEATRGALRLEPGHGGLLWTLPVELWARARMGPLRFTCGVGEPKPHVDVTLQTEIRIDDDWSLSTTTTAGERRWSRRCRVSFLNIDVTSQIDPHIAEAQARAARQIDREAARADLRALVNQIWPMLAFPLELEQEGEADERLRLLLRPEGLRVAELTGDASELRLRVAVAGRFLATTRFVSSPPHPLPPPGDQPAPPFALDFEVTRSLSELTAELGDALVGLEAPLGRGSIRVQALETRLTASGLALGLRVAGTRDGVLWAIAPLSFEAQRGVVVGPPVWTEETAAALDDDAETIGNALAGQLDGMQWPVDLAEARARILGGMRAVEVPEGVTVEASLGDASDGVVFGEGDALTVRVTTPGELRVVIDALTVADGLGARVR